jgi:hypothetical protein
MNRSKFRDTLASCQLSGMAFKRATGVTWLSAWWSFHVWPTRSCAVAATLYDLLDGMTLRVVELSPKERQSGIPSKGISTEEAAEDARKKAHEIIDELRAADPLKTDHKPIDWAAEEVRYQQESRKQHMRTDTQWTERNGVFQAFHTAPRHKIADLLAAMSRKVRPK